MTTTVMILSVSLVFRYMLFVLCVNIFIQFPLFNRYDNQKWNWCFFEYQVISSTDLTSESTFIPASSKYDFSCQKPQLQHVGIKIEIITTSKGIITFEFKELSHLTAIKVQCSYTVAFSYMLFVYSSVAPLQFWK